MPEPYGENSMRPLAFASAALLALATGPALADKTIDGLEFSADGWEMMEQSLSDIRHPSIMGWSFKRRLP
jgi:hypothetical protein